MAAYTTNECSTDKSREETLVVLEVGTCIDPDDTCFHGIRTIISVQIPNLLGFG
jgi:hypothetical protein